MPLVKERLSLEFTKAQLEACVGRRVAENPDAESTAKKARSTAKKAGSTAKKAKSTARSTARSTEKAERAEDVEDIN